MDIKSYLMIASYGLIIENLEKENQELKIERDMLKFKNEILMKNKEGGKNEKE